MNQFNYKKTPENVPFISNRADPYVTRHDDGTYYFTASVPEYDRIILRKSDSLMGLREAPEKTVWKKHPAVCAGVQGGGSHGRSLAGIGDDGGRR